MVGPSYVSDEDFTLETYSRDTSPLPPNKQGIVVRPASTDEVVDIVKLANVTKIPIVPSGGRASFYGTPRGMHGRGIVVDMTRMNKLLNIDEVNIHATAEAGLTTAEFTTRLWDAGWDVHTAVQPWYPDTLGGQISGFGGGGAGMEMGAVGFNATHIGGVKVVLPDATVVQTGTGAGNNIMNKMIYDRYPGGPDITGLFMGDGGTFGIKVEATYRMYKYAPLRVARATYFESTAQAWDMCLELSLYDPIVYQTCAIIEPSRFMQETMGLEKQMTVIVAKGNTENEMNAKLEIIDEILAKHKGVEATGPGMEAWKSDCTTGRRFREMGEFSGPGTYTYFEYHIARSQVLECQETTVKFVTERLEKEGIEYRHQPAITGVGAPTWIVSTIYWIRGEDKHAQQVMQEAFAEATELAASRGWYPDCHQGWGTRMMAKYWPKHHYEMMKRLKGTLDPNNIMNPGVWDL